MPGLLMSSPKPGDMVIVAPIKDYTGYMIVPALYMGEEWEDASEAGAILFYTVLFKGKVVKIPARTHKVEILKGDWPGGKS
tara:strand:- start:2578 stop:2820 length:243 start_codon:yes stop_codon:yes gene_type:complete